MTSDNLNDAIFEFFKKIINDNEILRKRLWNFLKKEMDSRRNDLDLNDWTYYFLQIQDRGMKDRGKTITQIMDQMVTHGVILPDENPAMVISSKLRRDNRFSFSQEEGWKIRDITEDGEDADETQHQPRVMPNDAEETIAELVYAELDVKSKIDLGRYLRLGTEEVPYNVDVGLLRKFRQIYRRLAKPHEKDRLRDAIRKESRKNNDLEIYG